MNIYDELCQQKGSNFMVVLNHLGGNASEICGKYQESYENGMYSHPSLDYLFGNTSPEERALRDAYNEIKHEILTRWLSRVPRQDMITVLNTLSSLTYMANVSYLPDETLSISELMHEWNDANPNEQHISLNSNYLP